MSDEKLYNIPFDGESPEPNVRDHDPPSFIEDLKLANEKLAEAQALIVKLNEQNAILVEALKEASKYANCDDVNGQAGCIAKEALAKVGVK